MAPDAVADLVDHAPPGQPRQVAAPATAAITQERNGATPLSVGFVVGMLLLGLAAGVTAYVLGLQGDEQPAETTARPLAFGFADADLAAARAASAVAVGVTVSAMAFAGRSFSRSGVAGLLAAALVALDPAVLAYGRLALPTALAVAAMAVALACMVSANAGWAWVGSLALAAGAVVDPRVAAWGLPLAVVLVLRGNIYASPRHVGIALLQALIIPLAGAAAHWLVEGMWASVPSCLAPPAWSLLTLRAMVQPGEGLAAAPNPVTWLAGLGALLFLGLGALAFGATRFRLARANGRVQARLVAPFPAVLGRGGWLLLLALAVALPQAWVLLFALALALGVQDLGEDAPGFGLTLAVALLLFAGVVLWRSWAAVSGLGGPEGVADALALVPWAEPVQC